MNEFVVPLCPTIEILLLFTFWLQQGLFSVWADNYILENNDNIFQPRWRTIDLYFQKSQTQCLLDFHDFHFSGDMYASPTCGLHGRSEWGDYGRGDRKHLPDPPSGGREGLGRDMVVPGWYNIPISYSNIQGIAPQTPLGSLSGLARPNHSTPAIFRQGVWTRIGVHLKKFNPITLRFPVFVWIKIYGQYLPVIYVWSWTFWTILHIWDLWDHMVVGLVVAPDVSGRPIPTTQCCDPVTYYPLAPVCISCIFQHSSPALLFFFGLFLSTNSTSLGSGSGMVSPKKMVQPDPGCYCWLTIGSALDCIGKCELLSQRHASRWYLRLSSNLDEQSQ